MTNLKIKTAVLLILSLAFFLNIKAQDDDAPIKVNTFLVNIPVIASDRDGRNIAGLKKENFTIMQDGVKQDIEFFADAEAPVSVAIMIDTSGSTLRIINEIKSAARSFIKVLRPEDQAVIVSFDGQYKFLSEMTANHKKLESAINNAKLIKVEDFSMYDAIYDVVKIMFKGIQGRKAIILLTDGGEHGHRITGKQLVEMLTESDTVIYPILFKSPAFFPKTYFPASGTLSKAQIIKREQILKTLEDGQKRRFQFINTLGIITGGKLYESDSKEFKRSFQSIADELKKQYLIGFYPQNVDDGNPHQVTVTVNPKDIVIRTKRVIRLKNSDFENK